MNIERKNILSGLEPNNPLLILDLANNHNGSLSHGKRIIDEITESIEGLNFKVAIKFQYRDLPNFIHPDYRERRDLKYVDRFLSTQLSWDDFHKLRVHIRDAGHLAACTPFDEYSVEKVIEHEFDILKIASASCTDWPLLESISAWEGPIVASTAGVAMVDVDRVVSFFKNRGKDFAIMHCVAAYPTPDDQLLLSRIRSLKMRYSNVPVGYSTHESPSNMSAGPLALALGAVILERHVGSAADGNILNGYSSDVSNLRDWLKSLSESIAMFGDTGMELQNESENIALRGLRRYTFARRPLKGGEKIKQKDVFFAIPGESGQLQANDLGKYVELTVTHDIVAGESLSDKNVTHVDLSGDLAMIRGEILQFIQGTNIQIPLNQTLEISHHYGIDKFFQSGLAMITLVNLDYCKKYLILLKNQRNPAHYHKIKDETFFVLYGKVHVALDDDLPVIVSQGESIHIPTGCVHEFWSESGAIIEELSTKHTSGDSFYIDEKINNAENRKSFINYWMSA